mmetsp:Transcript_21305/g.49457  ORF Transcript_21305/g.49457 Transcript_21305/m.49457 type:complete len:234 (+) Transcript_21305:259-960(+)
MVTIDADGACSGVECKDCRASPPGLVIIDTEGPCSGVDAKDCLMSPTDLDEGASLLTSDPRFAEYTAPLPLNILPIWEVLRLNVLPCIAHCTSFSKRSALIGAVPNCSRQCGYPMISLSMITKAFLITCLSGSSTRSKKLLTSSVFKSTNAAEAVKSLEKSWSLADSPAYSLIIFLPVNISTWAVYAIAKGTGSRISAVLNASSLPSWLLTSSTKCVSTEAVPMALNAVKISK